MSLLFLLSFSGVQNSCVAGGTHDNKYSDNRIRDQKTKEEKRARVSQKGKNYQKKCFKRICQYTKLNNTKR